MFSRARTRTADANTARRAISWGDSGGCVAAPPGRCVKFHVGSAATVFICSWFFGRAPTNSRHCAICGARIFPWTMTCSTSFKASSQLNFSAPVATLLGFISRWRSKKNRSGFPSVLGNHRAHREVAVIFWSQVGWQVFPLKCDVGECVLLVLFERNCGRPQRPGLLVS